MKRILLATIVSAFMSGASALAAEVVVFDSDRVQNESIAGKDFSRQMAASPMEDERVIQAKYQQMAADHAGSLEAQIQKKTVTPEKARDDQKNFIQDLEKRAGAELGPMRQRNIQRQAAAKKAMDSYRGQLDKIVADIAAKRGASVVLDKQIVMWSAGSLDVTSEVISRLDAALPGLTLDLPAAPAGAAPAATAAPRAAVPPRQSQPPKR